MRRIIAYFLFLLFPVFCYGQNIRYKYSSSYSENIRDDLRRKGDKTKPKWEGLVKSSNDSLPPDTVYSIGTIKKHGWFVPSCVISKEQSKHRQSVMFTGRNKQGHWTKIETIDAYGNHSKGFSMPYILRNGTADNAANKDWIDVLKESCIVEFISDPSGDNVIQERVYDENHKIIYLFSHTPIGKNKDGLNQYIGAYKDVYGLPAEMRETPEYTYGTIVRITEDKWGHDHIIEYLDAKGKNKLNGDSVFQSVHTYDEYGHELKFGSQNERGDYVLDSWGNCGVIQTWNKDHTMSSAMYTDTNWRSMRMPSTKAQEKTGVIKVFYEYDEYKRETLERFVDENDNPMTNIYGAHKIVYKYDNKGNTIELAGFDLENKPSPVFNGTTSRMVFDYDSLGREIQASFYDKYNKPVEGENLLSKRITQYNDLGEKILFEEYHSLNSEEEVCYRKKKGVNTIHTLFYDGTIRVTRVDSLDEKGRTIKSICYDEKNQLYVPEKWAVETIDYIDQKGATIMSETTYDEKLHEIEVDGIAKTKTVVDSLNNSLCKYRYDKYGELKETFGHFYDKEYKWVLSEYDMNKFGIICRSGGTAGVRHYVADVVYSQKHSFATLVGRDEYNEPDYITSDGGKTYYYQKLRSKGRTVFYDENNNPISDFKALRDSLPKALSIEVVDSIAYSLGIKDNDVILRYGTYINNVGKYSQNYERKDWATCAILAANSEKQILVYRVDNTSTDGSILRIELPKGTTNQLGFLTHMRYLTKRQANRIGSILDRYKRDNNIQNERDWNSLEENMANENGDKELNLVYPELYRRNRNKPYPHYVTDVGFLLGYYIQNSGESWICDGTTEKIDSLLNDREGSKEYAPHITYYFTTDMENVKILNSYENFISANWSSNTLSDKNFDKIKTLIKIVNSDISQKKKNKQSKKLKKNINSAVQIIRDNYASNRIEVENDYKGVDRIELYNFEGDYETRDNAYNIIESIDDFKDEQYTKEAQDGYGSICLLSTLKANRIAKCFLFTSKKLIYAEGEFSQVQLNKISNLLK